MTDPQLAEPSDPRRTAPDTDRKDGIKSTAVSGGAQPDQRASGTRPQSLAARIPGVQTGFRCLATLERAAIGASTDNGRIESFIRGQRRFC